MNKRNALQELLSAFVQTDTDGAPDHKIPAYGAISWEPYYAEPDHQILVKFDGLDEFNAVKSQLDFDYDAGYGTQELFGTVVFTDGTWISRGEYDGSEWWAYHSCPTRNEVLDAERGTI